MASGTFDGSDTNGVGTAPPGALPAANGAAAAPPGASEPEPLTALMELVVPGGPARVGDAGAALALAVHIALVEAGLEVQHPSGVYSHSRWG